MPSDEPRAPTWSDRIRHWLWFDRPRRTDNSEASRHFYTANKPVGWRFLLIMIVIGIAIGLAIVATRDTEAWSVDDGQLLVFEEPGITIAVPADQGADPADDRGAD